MTTPHMTTPHMTAPDMTTPDMTTPHMTTPHMTTPRMTTPCMTTPHMTAPDMTTPDTTTPDTTTPDTTTPDTTTPDTTTPDTTTPDTTTPDKSLCLQEREKDNQKTQPVTLAWSHMLSCLVSLAMAEKAYASLLYLGQNLGHKLFGRKDVRQKRFIFDSLVQFCNTFYLRFFSCYHM